MYSHKVDLLEKLAIKLRKGVLEKQGKNLHKVALKGTRKLRRFVVVSIARHSIMAVGRNPGSELGNIAITSWLALTLQQGGVSVIGNPHGNREYCAIMFRTC